MSTCQWCHQPFHDPKHPNKKFCSKNCYVAFQRRNVVPQFCQYCHKKFTSRDRSRKYCSHDCSSKARRIFKSKRCPICNLMFQPNKNRIRYCSWKCYLKDNKQQFTCEICGKLFEHNGGKNRFCSYDCARIGHRTRFQKECEICSKLFWTIPSKAHREFCCSWKCRNKRRHRPLTCEWCGKTVEVQAHVIESGKYTGRFCSYECAAAWQKGENHSNWQGGHEKWRGPNWRRQSKAARKRDDYTCQNCGVTKDELGRPLDVHHVIPWRDFDGDWKKANRLDNLISLCQSCHTSLEPRGRNRTIQHRLDSVS